MKPFPLSLEQSTGRDPSPKIGAPLCVRQSTFGTHGPDTCFPTQSRLAAAAHSFLLPSTVSHCKRQLGKRDGVCQNTVDQGRPDHPRHRSKTGSAAGSNPESICGNDIRWMVPYKAKKEQASVIKLLIEGGNPPENNTKKKNVNFYGSHSDVIWKVELGLCWGSNCPHWRCTRALVLWGRHELILLDFDAHLLRV